MPRITLTELQKNQLDELVRHYEKNKDHFDLIVKQLLTLFSSDKELFSLVHSMKYRVKQPSRLRDKLRDKMLEANRTGERFDIHRGNLFQRINDLAGLRILHLYTRQYQKINQRLVALLEEEQYRITEGPIAKTWDDESRRFFAELGIQTEDSPSLYTSVHYVIEPNSRTRYTCEIQVRTLAEEVWGEVSHTLNYPTPIKSVACLEQINVLARVTSSCTRLVDSIFRTSEEHWRSQRAKRRSKNRSR
jgi:ppGpp synthetase/RelA/SpoT-type nucleotidyltranferase